MRLYTHTHTHTHGYSIKDKKGITLIALVITIIVLLILAGVSINMISGDDGIATQASNASEKTRGGKIKEQVGLIIEENKIANYQGDDLMTKDEVIEKLVNQDLLTEGEVAKLDNLDEITVGGITIDFSELEDDGFDYLGRKYLLGSLGYTIFNEGADMILYDHEDNVLGQIPAACMSYNEKLVTISGTGDYDGKYRFSDDDHYVYFINGTEESLIGIEEGYCKHYYEENTNASRYLNYDLSDLNNPKVYCQYCGDGEVFDCQYINGILYSYNVNFDFTDTADASYIPINGYSALVWDKTLETVEFEDQINGIDVVRVGGFQVYTDKTPSVATNIIFPSNVKIISYNAFGNNMYPEAACKNLTSITIPNTVTTIQHLAFANCTNLSYVEIPTSVTFIGDVAFGGCDSLEEITYNGTIKQWNKIELDEGWNHKDGGLNPDTITKVICTDGEITY